MLSDTQVDTGKDKRLLVLLSFGALILLPHFFSTPTSVNFPTRQWVWFEQPARGGHLYRRPVGESGPHDATRGREVSDDGFGGEDTLSPRAAFLLGRPLPINQAGAPELQMLPGIGPKLAQRITAFRQKYGPIKDKNAFQQVPGIGPRLADRLTPLLSFRVR